MNKSVLAFCQFTLNLSIIQVSDNAFIWVKVTRKFLVNHGTGISLLLRGLPEVELQYSVGYKQLINHSSSLNFRICKYNVNETTLIMRD